MKASTGRLIRALVLGALLAFVQGGLANAESPSASQSSSAQQTPPANGTLTVSPPLVSLAVAPGSTGTDELTLHAGVSLDVQIAVDGLGQEPDGNFQPLTADKDVSPYSARTMMAVAPQTFRMEAGSSQKVAVTVTVPKDAGEGTRYAILEITGMPVSGDENVGIGVELGVSSLVSLDTTKQTRSGAVQDLAVGKVVPGQPLAVTGTLTNTGNSHYGAVPDQVSASATLEDANGDVLGTGKVTLSGNSIVPTFGRQFSLSVTPSRPLSDGSYHLEVQAGLQDGTVLDRAGLDFQVASGSVLGATGVPVQTLTTNGGPSDSAPVLLLGVMLGVCMGVLGLGFIARREGRAQRRRTTG